MDERRQLSRWRLLHHLRVHDLESGALLGHVADISVAGMMLVSSGPVALGRDYRVSMVLPARDEPDGEPVELRVRALWHRRHENEALHDIGFRLVAPAEEIVLRIHEMIEDLGFPGDADGEPDAAPGG